MFRFKEASLAKYKGKAIADIKEGGKILLKILPCFFTIFSMPCMAQKQHGKASYYSKKQREPELPVDRNFTTTV